MEKVSGLRWWVGGLKMKVGGQRKWVDKRVGG